MNRLTEEIKELFDIADYELEQAAGHEGGRNTVFICSKGGENRSVLRVSETNDRCEEDYLAETEFVRFLKENGAPVAGVLPSRNGKLVEHLSADGKDIYVSLFEYAPGILICDNGYRYREGAPIEEYFYNIGKTLGIIHRLAKLYRSEHKRMSYFDKYNMHYIDSLIPDDYGELKRAIEERLREFEDLPTDKECFGPVHFDYSDGNYHVDLNSGAITVFDFDNCMNCWYMFDLANTWTHGVGWCMFETDPAKRVKFIEHFFETVLQGYESETNIAPEMLNKLQLFIDMVLIENIVDEFECAAREGEDVDPDDIANSARYLIDRIPLAGIGGI